MLVSGEFVCHYFKYLNLKEMEENSDEVLTKYCMKYRGFVLVQKEN